RLMNAMRQAHADGWFIVFDTLTLADDRLEAFYDNPNALRDYFRDIGRMVLASNKLNRSRKARVSYKVQRTINASLNAATSTRAVSSNPNFVTRQKIEIIFG